MQGEGGLAFMRWHYTHTCMHGLVSRPRTHVPRWLAMATHVDTEGVISIARLLLDCKTEGHSTLVLQPSLAWQCTP